MQRGLMDLMPAQNVDALEARPPPRPLEVVAQPRARAGRRAAASSSAGRARTQQRPAGRRSRSRPMRSNAGRWRRRRSEACRP